MRISNEWGAIISRQSSSSIYFFFFLSSLLTTNEKRNVVSREYLYIASFVAGKYAFFPYLYTRKLSVLKMKCHKVGHYFDGSYQ